MNGTHSALQNARIRLLNSNERSFQTGDPAGLFPVVIEPSDDNRALALKRLLNKQSSELKRVVHMNGAVLFRGWDIRSEREFEECVFNIKGIVPLGDQLSIEQGRDRVPGTENIYYTNTTAKTGGTFQLPGLFFHSENYYHPEVPGYQFFWSKRAPVFGGETALIHMANAYQFVPRALKRRLQSSRAFVRSWPLDQLARDYRVDGAKLAKVIRKWGLELDEFDSRMHVLLYKPPVFRHPVTGRCSLQINFKEMPAVSEALTNLLLPFYSGPLWSVHRLAWARPWLRDILNMADAKIFQITGARSKSIRTAAASGPPIPLVQSRVGAKLRKEDVLPVSEAMFDHCSVFKWKTGDILFFDNTQVLHCGMPGLGPRELRVIMANPISISYPPRSGLLDFDFENKPKERLPALIRKLKAQSR